MNKCRVLLFVVLGFIASCAAEIPQPSVTPLQVTDAWIRLVPEVASASAAYFKLVNASDQARVLVGVQSELADSVEMHTTVSKNGLMGMERMVEVAIPAAKVVLFEPGGKHVMLIGLHQPLKAGDVHTMHLQFADGSELPVSLVVSEGETGGVDHSHHHHEHSD